MLITEQDVVVAIDFAAYGIVQGSCGSYTVSDTCNADGVLAVVMQHCLGRPRCMGTLSDAMFGDPCVNVLKTFAIQVRGVFMRAFSNLTSDRHDVVLGLYPRLRDQSRAQLHQPRPPHSQWALVPPMGTFASFCRSVSTM